jgi:hypothetical protein
MKLRFKTLSRLFVAGILAGIIGMFVGVICNIWIGAPVWTNVIKTSAASIAFCFVGFGISVISSDTYDRK